MNDLRSFSDMCQSNKTEKMAWKHPVIIGGVLVFAIWSSSALAAESLDDLKSRMGIGQIDIGLTQANPASLSSLPVKGYKDGLAGFLRQYQLVPNPSHSFTSCGDDALVTRSGGRPGCVVSIKVARKNPDESFRDTGVRIEYGVALGAKTFQANNSAYAEHAIKGDGLLQAQFDLN